MAVLTALNSIIGADKQAKVTQNAVNDTTAAQERMNAANLAAADKQLTQSRADQINFYNQGRDDNLEYYDYGLRGLNEAGNLNGLNGAEAQTNALARFQTDPGYQFRMDQGLKAVQGSAAARGQLQSGNTLAGIVDYSQGLASQEYGNYYNKLAGMAGMGQQAASLMSGQGLATANSLTAAGNAATGQIIGANTNTANQLSSAYQTEGKQLSSIYGTRTEGLQTGLNALAGFAGYGTGGTKKLF